MMVSHSFVQVFPLYGIDYTQQWWAQIRYQYIVRYIVRKSSVVDPKSFFSNSNPICVLEPVRQRKKFFNRKNILFFSVKCLICDFPQFFFILQQCMDPNLYPNPNFFRIRIRPKFMDSFGFGSTTLLVTIVINDHLQFSAYNEITETIRIFKHEERCRWGARNGNVVSTDIFWGNR
jgi:hypothetical protein